MRQFKDKGHISYPQEKPQSTSTGGEGEGGQYGYITLRGGGGGACQTWIICIYIYILHYSTHMFALKKNVFPVTHHPIDHPARIVRRTPKGA